MSTNQTPATTTAPPVPTPTQSTFDVRIHSLRFDGSVRAIASVNINSDFAVRNVKVVEGSKGLFVSTPQYKAGNGEYKDICFPVTKEARERFNAAVLGAYEQALSQSQSKAQKQEAPEPTQSPQLEM